jgi:TRAP-type C4-dicarboxylate transport system substrate-binding protein
MSKDLNDDLSPADRQAFAEAARLGGLASRKFAAEAEANSVAMLQSEGMQIVSSIDKTKFADAMASVMPTFEKKFGRDVIDAVRNAKVASN